MEAHEFSFDDGDHVVSLDETGKLLEKASTLVMDSRKEEDSKNVSIIESARGMQDGQP